MRTQILLFTTATVFLLLLHQSATTHSLLNPADFVSPAPSPAPFSSSSFAAAAVSTQAEIDFIRTSCNSTVYPDVCYSSLAHYASAIQRNPVRLARVAIAISLSSVRLEAIYLANLSREADYGSDHHAAAALHDCLSVFADACDQIHGSIGQMSSLVSATPGGSDFQFQVSNVQTWMSAALTNEETCKDGFSGVPDGPTKLDVFDCVHRAEAVTSNALAFVNSYASQVTDSVSYH